MTRTRGTATPATEDGRQVALVTGASSGIGRATALALAEHGWTVYAGARSDDALADLSSLGLRAVHLDVTDDRSAAAAVAEAESEHGAVDLLVNNAGRAEMGAVEEVDVRRWTQQLETNVVGVVRLTQLVLPSMRQQGGGRVVVVGSMGGQFTFPYAGAYHASKYALEAFSDALRFEVAAFGIGVTLVQPGAVATPLAQAATVAYAAGSADSPYAGDLAVIGAAAAAADVTTYLQPREVADAILSAATSAKPPSRLKVGEMAEQMVRTRQSMDDDAWDGLLRGQYGLAGPLPAS